MSDFSLRANFANKICLNKKNLCDASASESGRLDKFVFVKNKSLTSVFYASVLLLIINSVITLSK